MPYLALFILQAAVLVLIAVTHLSALQWSLYWYYIWLDVPMHFAGGAWLALAGSWLLLRFGYKHDVLPVFTFVIVGSIGWEIFEVWAGVARESNFLFDTVLDLTMDVAGGIVGFIFARALIEPAREHTSAPIMPGRAESTDGTR